MAHFRRRVWLGVREVAHFGCVVWLGVREMAHFRRRVWLGVREVADWGLVGAVWAVLVQVGLG